MKIDKNLFYPLYKEFDKEFFKSLLVGIEKKYSFIGSAEEKSIFFKNLLILQMLKDYRSPILAIKEGLKQETEIKSLNQIIESQNYRLDYSWANWGHEKEMGRFAEDLISNTLTLKGNQEQYDELVLRYLLSIWLVDWEGPLYALLKITHRGGEHTIEDLIRILELWDFTGIFKGY
jgi:hypothetical protein